MRDSILITNTHILNLGARVGQSIYVLLTSVWFTAKASTFP